MVHGYQMDYFLLDEGKIHFSRSTSSNQYGSLTCGKYKKKSFPSAERMRIVFLKHGTKNTESVFELQYITVIVTKPVSHNKAYME